MPFLRNHQENRKKSANYQPITPKSTVSYKLQTINCNQLSPCGPIPHYHLARALMPRQPYSAAVKSDEEERLHPLSPEGKRAWEKRWSLL